MSIILIQAALKAQFESIAPIIPAVLLASVAVAANSLFTTATPHGLVTGVPVRILGYTGGTPVLDQVYLVQVASSTTFYLQNSTTKAYVGVTIPGSGGSVLASLTTYQGQIYQVVPGVPYHKIYVITFKPEEPTQGGGFYREHGVFQVTLVYPPGRGDGALKARAQLIRSYFKKGMMFSYGGVNTTIFDTPEFGLFVENEDNVSMPVKIGFSADIYT
jgi:hypothetical protein